MEKVLITPGPLFIVQIIFLAYPQKLMQTLRNLSSSSPVGGDSKSKIQMQIFHFGMSIVQQLYQESHTP